MAGRAPLIERYRERLPGVARILTKPFRPDELVRAVRQVLDE